MAFTLNRRLSQLVDSDGKLNTGKVPDNEITSDHLHTSFQLSASHVSSTIEVDDLLGVNQHLETTDDVQFNNLTLTGSLRGPATMTIDPAAVGDNTGTLVIAGNLQVDGTTTTINSTTLTVDDLNLTLASGAADSAAANGAGLTVDGASATLLWSSSDDRFNFNKSVGVAGTLRAVGSDSSNTNYAGIFRNSGGQNIMLMRNDGVVLMQQSYLFVNNSDGIFSDGSIKARGGILNDQGDLSLNDNVDITGYLIVDHGNWTSSDVVNVSTDQFDAGASFATGSFVLFGEHDGAKDKMLSLKKNSSDIFSVNSSGHVGIGTGDADADLHLNVADAEIRLQHAGNSYYQRILTDSANKLHFGTGPNGTIRMSLDTNNLEFSAVDTHSAIGNVLISIPDRQASIYNIGDRGNITIQASSSTTGSQALSGGRVLINAGNSNNGQSGDIILSSGSNIINSADSGKIRFNIGGRTSNEEAMRINSDGNVGIGTDTPTQRLEVDGDVRINDSRSLFFKRHGDQYAWRIRNESSADGSTNGFDGNNDLVFEVVSDSNLQATPAAGSHNIYSSSTNTLVLKEEGNVGIGTSSPGALLDISGAVYSTLNLTSQHGYALNRNWKWITNDFGSDNWGGIALRQSTGVGGDPTEYRFGITRDGNVGIGTKTPGSKLQVQSGSIKVVNSGTDAYFLEGVRDGGNVTLRMYDNANNLYIDSYSNMSFRANQNGGSGGNFSFSGGDIKLPNYTWYDSDIFKVYNISGPSTSSFTRTIDINSFWGYLAQGGFFMYAIHGWQQDEAAGLISWSNVGSNAQVIVNVYHREFFTPTFTSVTATKGTGDREIDITINGAHTNTHGWRWVVWA